MSLYSNQVLKYFSEELKKRFVKQGYNLKSIDKHVLHVKALEKEAFKKKNKINTRKAKFFKYLPATNFCQALPILFQNTGISVI